jgi:small subunit ribosomal protein S15
MMATEAKAKVSKIVQKNTKDVGSAEVQIAILSERITELSKHLKNHKKDNHSRRGLLQMVGRRKRLLKYLKANDFSAFENIIKRFNLRG